MQKLLELIKNNPNIPIVPMVDAELVGDDFGRWLGVWGDCELTEYYIGKERVHFKDDDEEDVLLDMIGCNYGYDSQGNDIYELSDKEWNKLYKSIPWKKCIVVYIDA